MTTMEAIANQLVGARITELSQRVEQADGRGVSIVDLSKSGLQPGADLGEGIKAGDNVLVITFGLYRGFLRPDQRGVLLLEFGNNMVERVICSRTFAK